MPHRTLWNQRRSALLLALQISSTLALVLLTSAAMASSTDEDAWSKFRGPDANGQHLEGLLPAGEFGLTEQWRQDIGPGYSGVSEADGRVFTAFTPRRNGHRGRFRLGLWR